MGESARVAFSCAVMDILFAYLCKCDKVRVGLDVVRGRDSGGRRAAVTILHHVRHAHHFRVAANTRAVILGRHTTRCHDHTLL